MKPSVWFIVPAHGRVELARVCLRQLARTCVTLAVDYAIDASAVVIADDENLETARELGFGTVERENAPLGRKWNDGYQLAGQAGVDYVIPFGSDDWIDPAWVDAQVRADGELRCSRRSAVVREDGMALARLDIRYDRHGGHDFGDGVRMIPTSLLAPLGYRPADELAPRAIDSSVFRSVFSMLGRLPRVSFREVGPLQIVDFKSPGEQLNGYAGCLAFRDGDEDRDPWGTLATVYPAEAVEEMRALYGVREAVAA